MQRLTQKDDQGNWSLKGVTWESLYEGQVVTKELRERLYGALWKLMEYEDAGLTPEEVEQLKESGRWIPVEERLPEEDDRVILCTKHGTVKGGTYTERYGYAMRKGFFTENCFEELRDVTAWMPLPRPYQEEEPNEEQ